MSCKKRKAYKLRHKIDFLRATTTNGDGGVKVEAWTVNDTVWADIRPVFKTAMDQVLIETGNRELEQLFKITIRYKSNIKVKDRIRFDNRFFMVQTFADIDTRKRYIELLVKEVEKAEVTIV